MASPTIYTLRPHRHLYYLTMDIKYVSRLEPYFKLLETHKKTFQAAQKRKGEYPTDAKPGSKVIDDHMTDLMSTDMANSGPSSSDNLQLRANFLPPPYLPSVAPFRALKKMPLKDLQLETHHRGRYLLLRVVTPPRILTGIVVIMDDEANQVVAVRLYQQEEESYRPARVRIKKNTACIIKEPYFKVMDNGDYGLRIDHVSDLIWLSDTDDRVPLHWRPHISKRDRMADKWKSEGDAAVKSGNFFEAAKKQV